MCNMYICKCYEILDVCCDQLYRILLGLQYFRNVFETIYFSPGCRYHAFQYAVSNLRPKKVLCGEPFGAIGLEKYLMTYISKSRSMEAMRLLAPSHFIQQNTKLKVVMFVDFPMYSF